MSEEQKTSVKSKKKKKLKLSKTGRVLRNTCIGCFLALIIIYLGVGIFFQSHFLWNTTVNGVDVSFKNKNTSTEMLESMDNGLTETLLLRDSGKEKLDLSDVDLTIKVADDISTVIKHQNGFLWPKAFFKNDAFDMKYDVSFDESKMKQAIEALSCMKEENIKHPQDAVIVYEGGFQIQPEDYGNEINEDKLVDAIKEALSSLSTDVDVDKSDCYEYPSIYKDDENLAKDLAKFKEYETLSMTYEFDGKQEILDCSTFYDWLSLNDEGEIAVDSEKVKEYVKELANTYDTVGTERQFKTSYNTTVTVKSNNFGYKMKQDDEVKSIKKAFTSKEGFDREPEYSSVGRGRANGNDIGNTYIEVNLTRQHVFCYKDGKMIFETDCVTGCTNLGRGTPECLETIKYKQSPSVLKGQDYETPVTFWMPFNGGIGLHDATWRSSFGGDKYIYHGSHGCVNLPWSAAQTVYNNFGAGTPVICYKDK